MLQKVMPMWLDHQKKLYVMLSKYLKRIKILVMSFFPYKFTREAR